MFKAVFSIEADEAPFCLTFWQSVKQHTGHVTHTGCGWDGGGLCTWHIWHLLI